MYGVYGNDTNIDDNKLEIYTLGQFKVCRGDRIISSEAKRSYKLWEFFKYLISNRDKNMHGETIIESLWPEHDYNNSSNSLRSMIYRLRQLIDDSNQHTNHSYIISSAGAYSWNKDNNCWLDTTHFQELCASARQISNQAPENAIKLYLEAVDIYKGDYLPELAYTEWTIPIRNHYHRLYIQAVLELINLLEKSARFSDIVESCEKALEIEFYKEEIHAAYLRSLIKIGNKAQARSHLEYASSVFQQEMGIDLTHVMPHFSSLNEIKGRSINLDLCGIQEHLDTATDPPGCILCNPDVFRVFYKTEMRRSERSGHPVFLGTFVLKADNTMDIHFEDCMECLQDTLTSNLRRGDVICRWNDRQYLLLLTNLDADQAVKAVQRIQKSFDNNCKYKIKTVHDIKPILMSTI